MAINFTGKLCDVGVVKFGSLYIWAERGLIHIEDARDNSYESYSVLAALERANAISEMLGNSTKREIYSEDNFDRACRKRHADMLAGMICIFNKAKIQGMPSDPTARRDAARSLPKTIVVPGLKYAM